MEKNEFTGIWIPLEILLIKDINSTDKIVLSDIYNMSINKEYCFASNSYLATHAGIAEKQLSRIITKLEKKDLITRILIRDPDTMQIKQRKVKVNKEKLVIRGGEINNLPTELSTSFGGYPLVGGEVSPCEGGGYPLVGGEVSPCREGGIPLEGEDKELIKEPNKEPIKERFKERFEISFKRPVNNSTFSDTTEKSTQSEPITNSVVSLDYDKDIFSNDVKEVVRTFQNWIRVISGEANVIDKTNFELWHEPIKRLIDKYGKQVVERIIKTNMGRVDETGIYNGKDLEEEFSIYYNGLQEKAE